MGGSGPRAVPARRTQELDLSRRDTLTFTSQNTPISYSSTLSTVEFDVLFSSTVRPHKPRKRTPLNWPKKNSRICKENARLSAPHWKNIVFIITPLLMSRFRVLYWSIFQGVGAMSKSLSDVLHGTHSPSSAANNTPD